MQPATINPTLDMCTRYPLRLGGPRQCGIQSLPDTSTHGKHWELNPRPTYICCNYFIVVVVKRADSVQIMNNDVLSVKPYAVIKQNSGAAGFMSNHRASVASVC